MRGRKIEIVDGKKLCAKCGETKSVGEYGANKQSPTGLTSYCKACLANKAREIRATPEGQKRHYEATVRWIANKEGGAYTGRKLCLRCRTEKPFDQFPKNRRTKHGIGTYCLTCAADIVRERRATPEGQQAHRDASKRWREANNERHKDNNAKGKYGIAHGTYDIMLAEQNGQCAICKTTNPGVRLDRFHIDHCHSSKAIRGLLCEHCNRGLGHFKDDPMLLHRAAYYLSPKPS